MTPYSLTLIAGPDDEPISLDDAKYQLRAFDDAEDSYIQALIPVARKAVEHETGRALGVQTFELGLPYFPFITEFPRPPLVEIQKITYKDTDEAVTTLLDTEASPPVLCTLFGQDLSAEPGLMYLKPAEHWPIQILALGYPVRITYTAGLSTVPVALKHAVLLMVAHLYANREAVTDGQFYELPFAFKALCAPYRYDEAR